MNFYRTFHSMVKDCPRYDTTMDEAKAVVQTYNMDQRPLVRVELIDVPTDKGSICRLLNDADNIGTVLRTWCGTARGGVKEIANGE